MKITFTSISDVDGNWYLFSDEEGREVYSTTTVRTAEQGVHMLAHMAHKRWLDREQYGRLAQVVCDDLGCWK